MCLDFLVVVAFMVMRLLASSVLNFIENSITTLLLAIGEIHLNGKCSVDILLACHQLGINASGKRHYCSESTVAKHLKRCWVKVLTLHNHTVPMEPTTAASPMDHYMLLMDSEIVESPESLN
jgi:hypothetical protein